MLVNVFILLLGLSSAVGFHSPLIKHSKFKSQGRYKALKNDLRYKIQIGIGTPVQTFNVVIDLTSWDSWIADKNCVGVSDCEQCYGSCHEFGCTECCALESEEKCPANILYDPSTSSTYKSNQTKWENFGNNFGYWCSDVVTLTGTETTANEVKFAQVETLDWETFGYTDFGDVSGSFGIAISNQNSSIFEQGVQAGAFEDSKIGIWLNGTFESKEGDIIGGISFGSYDKERCPGVLSTVPLANAQWTIQLNGVSVGKYSFDYTFSAEVQLDADKLFVPYDVYDKILVATNAHYDDTLGIDVADCNQTTQLKFKTDAGDITLDFADYTERRGDVCVYKILEGNVDDIGLGFPFLSKYCAIVDVKTSEFSYTPLVL
ncbi:Eukaryotic aspartyl protease [Aphelenchoides besseyi]|nr:Eukaryotic aspartyl protease [Aphelenchoides besseyi]